MVDLPSTLKVEVYPVEIFLCLHSNMENVITDQFSRTDSIREFVYFYLFFVSAPSQSFLRGAPHTPSHTPTPLHDVTLSDPNVRVRRCHPDRHVPRLLRASGLRVPSVDEEFGQQLRASQERARERAGCLLKLRDGENTPTSASHRN